MTRTELLEHLATVVVDGESEKTTQDSANQLFPKLESLIDDFSTKNELESLIMQYANAYHQRGFIEGFETALTLLLKGNSDLSFSEDY